MQFAPCGAADQFDRGAPTKVQDADTALADIERGLTRVPVFKGLVDVAGTIQHGD